MQKVEGSSPFSRSSKKPCYRRVSFVLGPVSRALEGSGGPAGRTNLQPAALEFLGIISDVCASLALCI
jgi:hypothetical protein